MAATESTRDVEIMRSVWQKLDQLPLGFGMPEYSSNISNDMVKRYFSTDLNDTMRELGIQSFDSVPKMSQIEMMVENRSIYYALRRFRNSAAIFFKFSSATDGKTVDKSMIPKMLLQLIKEYDEEFKKWRMTTFTGTQWDMTSTVNTSGEVATI